MSNPRKNSLRDRSQKPQISYKELGGQISMSKSQRKQDWGKPKPLHYHHRRHRTIVKHRMQHHRNPVIVEGRKGAGEDIDYKQDKIRKVNPRKKKRKKHPDEAYRLDTLEEEDEEDLDLDLSSINESFASKKRRSNEGSKCNREKKNGKSKKKRKSSDDEAYRLGSSSDEEEQELELSLEKQLHAVKARSLKRRKKSGVTKPDCTNGKSNEHMRSMNKLGEKKMLTLNDKDSSSLTKEASIECAPLDGSNADCNKITQTKYHTIPVVAFNSTSVKDDSILSSSSQHQLSKSPRRKYVDKEMQTSRLSNFSSIEGVLSLVMTSIIASSIALAMLVDYGLLFEWRMQDFSSKVRFHTLQERISQMNHHEEQIRDDIMIIIEDDFSEIKIEHDDEVKHFVPNKELFNDLKHIVLDNAVKDFDFKKELLTDFKNSDEGSATLISSDRNVEQYIVTDGNKEILIDHKQSEIEIPSISEISQDLKISNKQQISQKIPIDGRPENLIIERKRNIMTGIIEPSYIDREAYESFISNLEQRSYISVNKSYSGEDLNQKKSPLQNVAREKYSTEVDNIVRAVVDTKHFAGKATNNIETDDEEPIVQDNLILNVLRDENGRIQPKVYDQKNKENNESFSVGINSHIRVIDYNLI